MLCVKAISFLGATLCVCVRLCALGSKSLNLELEQNVIPLVGLSISEV